jgi:hypothetical protein
MNTWDLGQCSSPAGLLRSAILRHSSKFDAEYVPNTVDNIRMAKLELEGNGAIYRTKMVAGSVGISVTKSGEKYEDGQERLDSVRSVSGWVMYELKSGEEMEEMEEMEKEEKRNE